MSDLRTEAMFAERLRKLSQDDWKDIAECLEDLPEVSDAEAEEIAKQFQKPTESMGW